MQCQSYVHHGNTGSGKCGVRKAIYKMIYINVPVVGKYCYYLYITSLYSSETPTTMSTCVLCERASVNVYRDLLG